MSGEIRTSVILDLSGNLVARARQMQAAMTGFGRGVGTAVSGASGHLATLGTGMDALGNRYTALLTGAAGVGTVRELASLETRLTAIGVAADVPQDRLAALKQTVLDTAQMPDIRLNPNQILDAIDEILEKTGDLDFAMANARNIGLTISASGGQGLDVGGVMAELQKMGVTAPKDVLEALDILNVQGKEGAFTLQNLARLGPRAFTAYTAKGRGGLEAVRELGAALQVIRQGTGNAEQAATSFEAVLRTLVDPAKVKMLGAMGIKLFDPKELEQGREVLRPLPALLTEIIVAARGKGTLLGEVFDAEAIRAFNAILSEYNRTGAVTSLEHFLQVQADGSQILKDAALQADTLERSLTNLHTTWTAMADRNLAKPIQDLTDSINRADPETVDRNMEWGAKAIAGLGALWAGNKAWKFGKWGWAMGRAALGVGATIAVAAPWLAGAALIGGAAWANHYARNKDYHNAAEAMAVAPFSPQPTVPFDFQSGTRVPTLFERPDLFAPRAIAAPQPAATQLPPWEGRLVVEIDDKRAAVRRVEAAANGPEIDVATGLMMVTP